MEPLAASWPVSSFFLLRVEWFTTGQCVKALCQGTCECSLTWKSCTSLQMYPSICVVPWIRGVPKHKDWHPHADGHTGQHHVLMGPTLGCKVSYGFLGFPAATKRQEKGTGQFLSHLSFMATSIWENQLKKQKELILALSFRSFSP
jgi:hypothetical protein